MIDLNAFMEQSAAADVFDPYASTRVRVSEDELSDRLDFYAANDPDFEATQEHLDMLIAIFHEHRNVFVTGGAGTGKTTFIRQVVMPELDYRNLHWSVTATTGIAGSHLEGKTIHSFFGIGLGPKWSDMYPEAIKEFLPNAPVDQNAEAPCPQDMDAEELEAWYSMHYQAWLSDPKTNEHMRRGVISRLKGHEVVLIDEISMCAGSAMLGYLDFMLRQVRGNEKPFGGLQLVFIGDFAQLPPVEIRDGNKPDWAFLSSAWDNGKVLPMELTKVFRQGDQRFIQFLNNVRDGIITESDREYARQFVTNNMTLEQTKNYTFLVPTNRQAHQLNVAALDNYPAPTHPIEAEFVIVPHLQNMKDWERRYETRVQDQLVKALRLVGKTTFLRIGYPVMFTINAQGGEYVNGTRGFVREINLYPRTRDNPEDMDNIVVGIPSTKEGEPERKVKLTRWDYSRDREQDPTERIPVPLGFNEQHEVKLPAEISKYPSLRQFPLIPATAITIHKSQGMSLDMAILALAKSFAAGQVYVGLSRLRSPQGMVLTEDNFEAKVDPYVVDYYQTMREQNATKNKT